MRVRGPDHVRTWRPPDALRGTDTALADLDAAIGELEAGGNGVAAAILDGVLTSDGIIDLDPGLAAALVDRVRARGRRSGSPTRSRAAMAGRGRTCGRTGGSGSRRTS